MIPVILGFFGTVLGFVSKARTQTFELIKLGVLIGAPTLFKIMYSWSKYFIDKLRRKNNIPEEKVDKKYEL